MLTTSQAADYLRLGAAVHQHALDQCEVFAVGGGVAPHGEARELGGEQCRPRRRGPAPHGRDAVSGRRRPGALARDVDPRGPCLRLSRRLEVAHEQPRGRLRVAQRRVRALVRHLEVGAAVAQPRRRAERPRVGHGAQRVLGLEVERPAGARELGHQEAHVERRVVRHDHAPVEQVGHVSRDAVERGRHPRIRRVDVVDVLRPQVPLRVHQRGPRPLASPLAVEQHHRDLADPVAAVVGEARGLEVEHGVGHAATVSRRRGHTVRRN